VASKIQFQLHIKWSPKLKKDCYPWEEYRQCKIWLNGDIEAEKLIFVYMSRLLTGEGAKEWAKSRGHVIVKDEDLIECKLSRQRAS
jgi:hypothetical protein